MDIKDTDLEDYERHRRSLPARQLFQKAIAAQEAGYWEESGRLSLAALSCCPPEDYLVEAIRCHRGHAMEKLNRIDDAIEEFERALPLPGAFSRLEVIFRRRAKEHKKAGIYQSAVDEMNRVVSLHWLHRHFYDQGFDSSSMDFRGVRQFLHDFRVKNGSVYPYSYLSHGCPEGTLSTSDRKLIETLCSLNAE